MISKDDIQFVGFCAIVVLVLGYAGWWMSIGADRSEYGFCLKQHMAVFPTEFQDVVVRCYDKTY